MQRLGSRLFSSAYYVTESSLNQCALSTTWARYRFVRALVCNVQRSGRPNRLHGASISSQGSMACRQPVEADHNIAVKHPRYVNSELGKITAILSNQNTTDSKVLGNLLVQLLNGLKTHPKWPKASAFEALAQQIVTCDKDLSEEQLIQLLHLYLTFSSDSPPRKTVTEHVLGKLDTFTPQGFLNVVMTFMHTHNNKEIFDYSVRFLSVIEGFCENNKLNNPTHALEIMFFLWKMKDNGPEAMRRVTVKRLLTVLVPLCSQLRENQLIVVLKMLSREQMRHVPLINAVTCELTNQHFAYVSLNKCRSILSDCCTLSYFNKTFLRRVCDTIVTRLSEIPEQGPSHWKLLTAILKSLKQLRFNHEVTGQIAGCLLQEGLSSLKMAPTKLCDVLQSCAGLSICDTRVLSGLDEALNSVHELSESQPELWLSAVCSTAILGRLTAERAESVLQQDYIQHLLSQCIGTRLGHVSHQLFLVNASAHCDLTDYSGPLLSQQQMEEFTKQLSFKKERLLAADKHYDIMLGLVPKNYIHRNVHTQGGHLIDTELLVTDSPDFRFLQIPEGDAETPHNSRRLAIQLLDFSATLPFHPHLEGTELMKYRHLQRLGYTVIQVPVWEVLKAKSHLDHINYMHDLIKLTIITELSSKSTGEQPQKPEIKLEHVHKNIGPVEEPT